MGMLVHLNMVVPSVPCLRIDCGRTSVTLNSFGYVFDCLLSDDGETFCSLAQGHWILQT